MSIKVVHESGMKLSIRGQEIPKFATTRATELLHFLISHHGQRFSRRLLQQQFWPDVPPEKAQNSLRQTLSIIKKALGDDCPIVAQRLSVYCRTRDLYFSVQKQANSPIQPLLNSNSESVPLGKKLEQFQVSLLESFRKEPVVEFLVKLDQLILNPNLDSKMRTSVTFLLAYCYNEIGQWNRAFEIANELHKTVETSDEILMAKHALGGILWHGGYFDDGMRMLWEAAKLASDSPLTQSHILSNIAIGAYEQGNIEVLEYASSLSRQTLSLADSVHGPVLKYISALEEISNRNHIKGERTIGELILTTSRTSHRLSVYAFEANAFNFAKKGDMINAREAFQKAFDFREAFQMHPSPVEKRRLRKLRGLIEVI
jgi:tetratricopeptide (TPR) repeat protein